MTVPLRESSIISYLEGCRTRLAKKATFEYAITEIKVLLDHSGVGLKLAAVQRKLVEVLARCMTLLKTRYTSSAFWKAGSDLLAKCQGILTSEVDQRLIKTWQTDCANILDEPASSAQAADTDQHSHATSQSGYLFEGQLSQAHEPPARPQGLEELLHLLAAQQVATRTEDEGEEGEPDAQRQADNQAYTQRLEEALMASLQDAEGGNVAAAAPPASKHAVKSLVREVLSEERLQQLGGPATECAVCREDLQVGEEVQIMPCNSNHVYHPDCLAPWLKGHNSCPVCRFELPTDDMAYENKKERDQREAEERKGAANAVSHTDFLYT